MLAHTHTCIYVCIYRCVYVCIRPLQKTGIKQVIILLNWWAKLYTQKINVQSARNTVSTVLLYWTVINVL